MSDFFKHLPAIQGKLEIYHYLINENQEKIAVIGDPEGLRSLSEMIRFLADWDQDLSGIPIGEREHIHIRPGTELGKRSCEVEICRADAKGTGKYPAFME